MIPLSGGCCFLSNDATLWRMCCFLLKMRPLADAALSRTNASLRI